MNTPVAFIIFKRPEHTRRVWDEIRKARPPRLFVIADGPRDETERGLCEAARAIVAQVDWDCDVQRNYASRNMGCKNRVASGLDWVFSVVEEAIILEDDCLPGPSFFGFCEDMLVRYRHDRRVMHISGNNFARHSAGNKASYHFSAYAHVWGWATWRRAWQHFDLTMREWPKFNSSDMFRQICRTPEELRLWQDVLNDVYTGETNSWAYIWLYTCFLHEGLSVVPAVNLVTNIGTGTDATHRNDSVWYMNLPAQTLFVSDHPEKVVRDVDADTIVFEDVHMRPPLAWSRRLANTLVSPWTYGALLRKMPVVGPLWGWWRRRRAARVAGHDSSP